MAPPLATAREKIYAASLCALFFLGSVAYQAAQRPGPCPKERVARLVSSEFRTVVVETESGRRVALFSPTVAAGDLVCVD